MSDEFVASDSLYVSRDETGAVRTARPAERARPSGASTPQGAAVDFAKEHADLLGIRPEWFSGGTHRVGVTGLDADEDVPSDDGIELRYDTEKPMFDTTTVSYQQTWRGLRVWGAGLTTTMRTDEMAVSGVQNTTATEIEVAVPDEVDRPVMGAKGLAVRSLQLDAKPVRAERVDGLAGLVDDRAAVVTDEMIVFPYHEADRLPPDEEHAPEFPQPLPPVVGVADGEFRIARELVVALPTPPRGQVVWMVVVDVETEAILYLRPYLADVNGLVFATDPSTAGSAVLPDASQASMNPLRVSVTLLGLDPADARSVQHLSGENVAVTDFEIPSIPPPTSNGTAFDFGARTDDFAAVNAYHHNDDFFRICADLGFTRANFFSTTTFPVPVDHRGRFGSVDGIEINASCSGNGLSGIANVDYELASTADLTNPIGLAVDRRIVMHELGGHGILYNHVNSANLRFAHSIGDSFAAILHDPDTQAADRFLTFPWVSAVIDRRHDRAVSAGWGFGGANDRGGYLTEQLLSTTHFRIYRSLGGDSAQPATRRFAARVTAYLMLRAVGTLTPATNPSTAAAWVQALLSADSGDWTTEGLAGGAYGKVIRWAFEQQGLFQAPGAPVPTAQVGAPPAVDVFIDDGRGGTYEYQPVHWNNPNVWNRRAADGGTTHEEPIVGATNFAYTNVRNRGTETAMDVVVRAFHCNPGVGLTWPDDWAPMTTPQLGAADIPPGGSTQVGPFSWTPSQADHECMFMVASATGDPSNIDNFGPGERITEHRLVPHDNNIGQRNVHPVAAGGGSKSIEATLSGRSFLVRNPFEEPVVIVVDVTIPEVLGGREWKVHVVSPGGGRFTLRPGTERLVTLEAVVGADVPAALIRESGNVEVGVTVSANGMAIGGMVYPLDPDLEAPERRDDGSPEPSHYLLRHLGLPDLPPGRVRVRRIGVDIDIPQDD